MFILSELLSSHHLKLPIIIILRLLNSVSMDIMHRAVCIAAEAHVIHRHFDEDRCLDRNKLSNGFMRVEKISNLSDECDDGTQLIFIILI